MFNLSMLSVTFHGRSWALPGGKGSEEYFQLTHTFSPSKHNPYGPPCNSIPVLPVRKMKQGNIYRGARAVNLSFCIEAACSWGYLHLLSLELFTVEQSVQQTNITGSSEPAKLLSSELGFISLQSWELFRWIRMVPNLLYTRSHLWCQHKQYTFSWTSIRRPTNLHLVWCILAWWVIS